jgi:polysaccharide biosynthesis/export protein
MRTRATAAGFGVTCMRHARNVFIVVSMVVGAAMALPAASQAQTATSSTSQRVQDRAAAAPVPARAPGTSESPGSYIIGPDDLLSVVFWRDAQMSGDVLVRPDGKISLPLLDDVQAAGLTPNELRERLVSQAKQFMTDAVASVAVKEARSRRVFITGQVLRPGQYPMTSFMTAVQLIATAGGLTDFAKSKDIRVLRTEHGQSTVLRFDYTKVTAAENPAADCELQPGDRVVVP